MLRSTRSKIVCLGLLLAGLLAAGILARLYTTRAGYLLRQGQAALADGKWDKALRYAEALEQRGYPDHARLLRGEVWVGQGRLAPEATEAAFFSRPWDRGHGGQDKFRLALGEFAQIKDEGERAVEGTVLGAECLVRLGERRLASEALGAVVKRQPDHREAHRWLAAIYIDLNSPYDAITHLREWGRLEPENGRPYRWIGFFYKEYNKPDEAIEAYREACRRHLEPALRADVLKELAETLIEGPADYQAALDTLAQWPEPPAGPEILTLRAKCLWGLGREAEAVRLVESALRTKPALPQALLLRAKIFLSDGQPQSALPLLETAVRTDPHDHVSRQHLMQACKQLGDDARAEQQRRLLEETRGYKDRLSQLHEKAARHPWDQQVRQEIADLCLKLNRTAEARMWLQAASACQANHQPPVP